jgi:membrane-associated protease RseP (regulator of RpoE activity)
VQYGPIVQHHELKILMLGLLLVPTLLGCHKRPIAAEISVEFPITTYPDLIYVPVTIGANEHLCVVDSGAGAYVFHTTLRPKLGASLGHKPITSIDGSISRAEVFKVPYARIGTISLNNDALTLCYDLSSIREVSGRDIDGLIGLPLFQSYIVQMDFDSNRIVICSPSISPEPAWGEPIKLSYTEAKLPTVLVDFGGGVTEQCVVDTGFSGPFWLTSKLYAKLLANERLFAGGEIPVGTVTGHRVIKTGVVPYVKIGGIKKNDLAVRDGTAESRIGLGYLRKFRVTIDIPHNRLYLAKGKEFDKPGKQRVVGIGLLRKNEKTVVTWIEPDSPAQEAGIFLNDELVTIAGEQIAGRPLEEIKWMLDEKVDPSGKLKLMFRRGNEQRNVMVTISDSSITPLVDTAGRPNKDEAAAIDSIQQLGGKITLDEDAPGKPVYGVNFSDTHIGDDDLKTVEVLPQLKALILARTKVTDTGLRHIEGLTQLRSLLLEDTRVTDAGLAHIKPLVHLTDLMLDNTQVTDAGLKQIGGLVELRRLGLDDTPITDEGLKQLRGLKALWGLSIMGTKVTAAGRKELKQAMPNLQALFPKDGEDQH